MLMHQAFKFIQKSSTSQKHIHRSFFTLSFNILPVFFRYLSNVIILLIEQIPLISIVFFLFYTYWYDLVSPLIIPVFVWLFFVWLTHYFFLIFCMEKEPDLHMSPILRKIYFWPNLSKKVPKKVFCIFFRKMLSFEIMQNEISVNSSLSNSMSGKLFVLKLLPKIFYTNQIAGFFEVISVKKIEQSWLLIFCVLINIRISYILVLLLLVDVTIHAQSTPNDMFVISL